MFEENPNEASVDHPEVVEDIEATLPASAADKQALLELLREKAGPLIDDETGQVINIISQPHRPERAAQINLPDPTPVGQSRSLDSTNYIFKLIPDGLDVERIRHNNSSRDLQPAAEIAPTTAEQGLLFDRLRQLEKDQQEQRELGLAFFSQKEVKKLIQMIGRARPRNSGQDTAAELSQSAPLSGELVESPETNRPAVLYHSSWDTGINQFEPRNEKVRNPLEGPVVFATPDKSYAACFLVPSDDSWVKIGRYSADGIAGPWKVVVSDEDRFRQLDKGGAIYQLPSESFTFDPGHSLGGVEWTSSDAVAPTAKETYESGIEAMKELGVDLYFVDAHTFDALKGTDDHGKSIIDSLAPV